MCQQPFQMLDHPLYRMAVPFRRDRAFSHWPAINRASAGGSLAGERFSSSWNGNWKLWLGIYAGPSAPDR